MASFKEAITKIFKNEGGYVDNSKDLGGTERIQVWAQISSDGITFSNIANSMREVPVTTSGNLLRFEFEEVTVKDSYYRIMIIASGTGCTVSAPVALTGVPQGASLALTLSKF